jgi:hypothetical protein
MRNKDNEERQKKSRREKKTQGRMRMPQEWNKDERTETGEKQIKTREKEK